MQLKPLCAVTGVLIAIMLSGCGRAPAPPANVAPPPPPPRTPPPPPESPTPQPVQPETPGFELLPDHFWGGTARLGELEVRAINRYWAGPARDMIPLAEALDQGLCVLTETGRHDAVTASVRGKLPVLVLAGDLLIGGRQDRFVASSAVLEPGDSILRVFCAEHERWTPDYEEFAINFTYDARRPQADLITKETIGAQAKQAEVDGAVAVITATLNAPTYRQIYDAPQADPITRMVRRADDIVSAFTIGFAVYRDDELIAVDMFHSTRVLQSVADQLMRCYAMTAVYGDVANWKFERKADVKPEPPPPAPERPLPENFEPPPPELPNITDDGLARFECRRRPNEGPIHSGIFRTRQ